MTEPRFYLLTLHKASVQKLVTRSVFIPSSQSLGNIQNKIKQLWKLIEPNFVNDFKIIYLMNLDGGNLNIILAFGTVQCLRPKIYPFSKSWGVTLRHCISKIRQSLTLYIKQNNFSKKLHFSDFRYQRRYKDRFLSIFCWVF
jgi:hypothetical protein